MTENKYAKDAKAKAPQELNPEELEKVAGGLGGEDIGVPRSGKGGSSLGYQTGGSAGDIAPKTSPDQIRGDN